MVVVCTWTEMIVSVVVVSGSIIIIIPVRATEVRRSKLILPSGLGYSRGVQCLA